MSQVRPRFDPNDPQYLCCCGCHVMTGAKIVASIYTVVAVGAIVLYYRYAIQSEYHQPSPEAYFTQWANMVLYLLVIVPVLLSLWIGVFIERQGFLFPTLICSIIGLFLTIVYTLSGPDGYQGRITNTGTYNSAMQEKPDAVVFYAIHVCSFVLQCWFFKVVNTAYYYIEYMRSSSTGVNVHIQQSEQGYVAVPKENPEP
uniref:DUF7027 domain-containing protein n=1 Tax=Plectus sambesii TaxID=2011161 RepID=A0A914UM22_9BILA